MKKIMLEVEVPDIDAGSLDSQNIIDYCYNNNCDHRIMEPAVQAQGEPFGFYYRNLASGIGQTVGVNVGKNPPDERASWKSLYTHPITSDRRENQMDSIDGSTRDELLLIELVLKGFKDCMAKSEGLRAVRKLLATLPNDHREIGDAQRAFPQSNAQDDEAEFKAICATINTKGIRIGGISIAHENNPTKLEIARELLKSIEALIAETTKNYVSTKLTIQSNAQDKS